MLNDDAAQGTGSILVVTKPMVGTYQYRVISWPHAFRQVLGSREEATDNPARDFNAAFGPHTLKALKVGLNVAFQKISGSSNETGYGGAKDLVGKARAVDPGIPGSCLD